MSAELMNFYLVTSGMTYIILATGNDKVIAGWCDFKIRYYLLRWAQPYLQLSAKTRKHHTGHESAGG